MRLEGLSGSHSYAVDLKSMYTMAKAPQRTRFYPSGLKSNLCTGYALWWLGVIFRKHSDLSDYLF